MAAKLSASTDAYLQGASAETAALALAAHHERQDNAQLLQTMQALHSSPIYALAVADLLPEVAAHHAALAHAATYADDDSDIPGEHARLDFNLRLFAARCIHAGREGVL